MKLTEEQIENMETEELEELIKNAFASEDMEFLLSVLPECDSYHEGFYSDYFINNFDNDAFKNRDIALILAECGYLVPKDLYENDEEVILASVAPSAAYNGFYIASDKLLSDKNFVIEMLSQINWSEELREVSENIDSYVPREVLEDEEFKEFIKSKIQELKEKEDQAKENAVYEEMSELEERRMDYYGEYSSQRKFYPSFLDFLKEKELSADGAEKSVIQDLIRSEENDKEQSEETSETPSELEQLASTKKELEQIVSELRENIASAQKLLASYEELLNGGKQNDSNEGQTFGEE